MTSYTYELSDAEARSILDRRTAENTYKSGSRGGYGAGGDYTERSDLFELDGVYYEFQRYSCEAFTATALSKFTPADNGDPDDGDWHTVWGETTD